MIRRLGLALVVVGLWAAASAGADPTPEGYALDVHRWQVIDSQSGPDNYYRVVEDSAGAFIRAGYKPPMETAVFGIEAPENLRDAALKLRWSWRATALPTTGTTCATNPDAAANVYVSWKRGLRWYVLKYMWATAVPKGSICERKRNLFVAQDAVVMESGGPTGVWATEEIDLRQEFRRHFADGDPDAKVPDFRGVAVMSDGDQTESNAGADYARFVLTK